MLTLALQHTPADPQCGGRESQAEIRPTASVGEARQAKTARTGP